MHPQLHMLIAPEQIADMHRDAARAVWRVKLPAPPGAARRSQRRSPTARIKIAYERMSAPPAHAGARLRCPEPKRPCWAPARPAWQ